MKLPILLFLSSLIIFTSAICRSASLTSKHLLGIAPEDDKYYKASSGTFKCKDGSKKFTVSQLNDDFCDCPDGTDEPGTSACPNGNFYCQNAGHVPLSIYSSRVNDGICDCCDGSDEYDGKIKCPNTCWEAGKVARAKLKKKIAIYKEGVHMRRQEVEQAKLALPKDEAELSKLKNEEKILKGLVQQLKERKEQIEEAEEKERLQKEKEDEERREAEEAKLREIKAKEKANSPDGESTKESTENDKIGLLEDSNDDDKIGKLDDFTNNDKIEQSEDSNNNDKIGLLEDSPSIQDVVENGHTVTQFEHDDQFRNDGSSKVGVEQVKEDFIPHAAMKEEDSVVADKTGLDTGSKEKEASESTESLSREELGRLVASRWTGEKTEQEAEEVDGAEDDDHENHEDTPKDIHDEEYNGYGSEIEDDHHRDDDDDDGTEAGIEDFVGEDHDDSSSSYKSESDDEPDLSDITIASDPTWLEKIQQTVRSILQAVNLFRTPVDKSEAAHVRKEYDESSAKLSKIKSRISSLTQKLKHDFGPEKEFYSFYGQCFESKQNKYVYKICPFKQASQVEEGHSTTRLGSWEKFEDSYRIMQFSSGDKCWNGPDRSLKVKLRCGLKNEVSDVDEPSRCEYLALLSTPALCLEDKLKELEDKLDSMNNEQPQGRDEL